EKWREAIVQFIAANALWFAVAHAAGTLQGIDNCSKRRSRVQGFSSPAKDGNPHDRPSGSARHFCREPRFSNSGWTGDENGASCAILRRFRYRGFEQCEFTFASDAARFSTQNRARRFISLAQPAQQITFLHCSDIK